jgi:hypothetical protein
MTEKRFRDAGGHYWHLQDYADMVARTVPMHVMNVGKMNEFLAHGEDLIVVSEFTPTCPKCAPWGGKVLSISGKTPGYPSYAKAEEAGLFLPRCLHSFALYLDEVHGAPDADGKISLSKIEEAEWVFYAQQEADTVAVPDSLKGDYADFLPLELNAAERKLLLGLNKASMEDGFEHGCAIIDGVQLSTFTSGLHSQVQIPDDIQEKIQQGKDVELYHSHTNVTPPSAQDFRQSLRENVSGFGVIARNQDVFIVRVGDVERPTWEEYQEEAERIKLEADRDIRALPGFAEWSEEERTYVAIREQAYRIARHFKWEMQGGSLNE